MNQRTIKLGATLGAAALALAAPAIASAQDQAPANAPDTGMPSANYAAPLPAVTNADQLDKLQSMGFVNQSSVLTARVNPNLASNFAPLSSERLNAALESVKVDDIDGITSTLAEYLNSQGIDPSSIVALNVTNNAIVVAHT